MKKEPIENDIKQFLLLSKAKRQLLARISSKVKSRQKTKIRKNLTLQYN